MPQSASLPAPRALGFGWLVWSYLALIAILLFFGPSLAPFSAYDFNPKSILLPPTWPHVFGTDEFGRDIFSRLLTGARPTLILAVGSAFAGVALGTPTGLLAGYLGGWWDEILMRWMDVLMAFPALVLAMLIIVMTGSNPVVVIVALAMVFWPRSARLVRAIAQDLARREFISSAQARGEKRSFILFREILPNLMHLIAVDLGLRIASAILLTASLSYLGVGVSAPTPAWGLMVREGQQFLQLAPWLVVFPCAAIAAISTYTVLAGDSLRRRFAEGGGNE